LFSKLRFCIKKTRKESRQALNNLVSCASLDQLAKRIIKNCTRAPCIPMSVLPSFVGTMELPAPPPSHVAGGLFPLIF
jgi:hypothetical protein